MRSKLLESRFWSSIEAIIAANLSIVKGGALKFVIKWRNTGNVSRRFSVQASWGKGTTYAAFTWAGALPPVIATLAAGAQVTTTSPAYTVGAGFATGTWDVLYGIWDDEVVSGPPLAYVIHANELTITEPIAMSAEIISASIAVA